MKAKLKLFYAPTEEQYYIFYNKDFAVLLYKVENINPLNILRVVEHGTMNPNIARQIIKEVEEFAIAEFKKINNDF